MKPIGIMTFHASYNCGSILQCMALQRVLKEKFNKESEVINFSNKGQRDVYSVFYKKKNLKNIVKNILCIPGKSMIEKHYEIYKNYIKNNIKMSKDRYLTDEQLNGIEDNYSMLISGSDQIWNVNCDDSDKAYFLSFANHTKKISYAASLGATDIRETPEKEIYKDLISQYNYLSVRENNAKKWIEDLTGKDVEVVLDPTLLINEGEWKDIEQPLSEKLPNKFIFYYAFGYQKENNEAINNIAKEHNMKVVIIDSKQWYIKKLYKYSNFILLEETGPNAYLNLIDKSEYVITCSFHGAAFSSIFHKKFIYINGKEHNPADDRAYTLLNELCLMKRFVTINDLSYQLLNEDINYKEVDEKKKQLQEKSIGFLRKAINE